MSDVSELRMRVRAAGEPAVLRRVLAEPGGRVGVPVVTERERWRQVDAEDLLAAARSEAATPWPVPLASDFARFFGDGDRTRYEDAAAALRTRTALFTVAAALTDDPDWVERAGDGAVLLCELSTWCWAAHERFAAEAGTVLPDPGRPFLDLGAGEVVSLLAWVDHVLGPRFDERLPGLRERIRFEAETRVLEPFLTDRSWHWLGLGEEPPHNWSAWIHSTVISAALLLCEDLERRVEVISLALAGLGDYLATIPADGGCDEGYHYWWNGPARAVEALELLARVGGPEVDLTDLAVLAESARFPLRMQLGGDWFVNHADGPARSEPEPWALLHRWGHRSGDAALVELAETVGRRTVPHPRGGLARTLAALTDPGWTASQRPDDVGRVPKAGRTTTGTPSQEGVLPGQVWLPDTGVLLVREQAGSSRGLTLVAKAGHNGERHNHNDVGSFTVTLDGVPVVVDAGRCTYTRDTFSAQRYRHWALQSQWHNVPSLLAASRVDELGTDVEADLLLGQQPGPRFAAADVTARLDSDVVGLSLDGGAAWAEPWDWRRELDLHRAGPAASRSPSRRARVQIRDRWRAPACHRVVLTLLLHGSVELDAGSGSAHVTAPGVARGLHLGWDPSLATARTQRRVLDDPDLTRVWGSSLTRLLLLTTVGSRGLQVTATVWP